MKTRRERLEAFRESVIGEAEEDRARILSEGHRDARQILSRAEAEAKAKADAIIEHAQKQADKRVEEAEAQAKLDAQALKLRRRETLLDGVRKEAQARLQTATEAEDYPDVVERLVREAVDRMGEADSLVIRGGETAVAVLRDERLEKLGTQLGRSLILGDPLKDSTGVIVKTTEGHRQYNNTLSERLSRQWDALRGPVYHILKGESV